MIFQKSRKILRPPHYVQLVLMITRQKSNEKFHDPTQSNFFVLLTVQEESNKTLIYV